MYFERLGFEMPPNENSADWFMDILSGEVPNSKIANIKPNKLPDFWLEFLANEGSNATSCLWRYRMTRSPISSLERFPTSGSSSWQPEAVSRSGRRPLTAEDDRAVVYQALHQHWDRVDVNQDGMLDAHELAVLLAQCAGVHPITEVVMEMIGRVAGEGCQCVTKQQCVEYLCSLSDDVANDQNIRRLDEVAVPTAKSLVSNGEQSEGGSPYESEGEASYDSSDSSSCSEDGWLEALSVERPGVVKQFGILIRRRLLQWWRMSEQRVSFSTVLVFASAVLATLHTFANCTPELDASALLFLHIAFAILLSIFSLCAFSNDRPLFWRESASGISVSAYFASRVLVHTLGIVIWVFLLTAVYFLIRQPWTPYLVFILPFFFNAYVATGWGILYFNFGSSTARLCSPSWETRKLWRACIRCRLHGSSCPRFSRPGGWYK